MGCDAVLQDLETLYPREGDLFHLIDWNEKKGLMHLTKGAGYLELELIWIAASARGAGFGERMLCDLCAAADRHGVSLFLSVVDNAHVSADRLEAWYARHGFAPSPSHCSGDDLVFRRDPEPEFEPELLPDPAF